VCVLQCVAVFCTTPQLVSLTISRGWCVLQCVAVCVCCSVLQYPTSSQSRHLWGAGVVAVYCSMLQCPATGEFHHSPRVIHQRCVTWHIRMCAMTHSYVCHDSFVCVTWCSPIKSVWKHKNVLFHTRRWTFLQQTHSNSPRDKARCEN